MVTTSNSISQSIAGRVGNVLNKKKKTTTKKKKRNYRKGVSSARKKS